MKLWILRPKDKDKLWEPWYDKAFGFVVCAEDEAGARLQAARSPGDEGKEAWLNDKHSTCVELTVGPTPFIVMQDFASA